jgi:ATP-dependent phosphofructokinase / diphosphate-dependent phosphofructokinase
MDAGIRTIGLANGGGDCPGLNAAIRGVVKAAITRYGWRVVGITNGFDGLIWPEGCVELTLDSVRGILPRGGTILGTTNHGNPFAYAIEEDGAKLAHNFSGRCIENVAKLGLDALVVIGGDGTLTITRDLGRLGVRVVGVPKTIDNDLSATEVTFGFDTALHVATDAIDRLHTTAESHGRVMVVEVMGREAGWIALHSGIAGGADVILVPEIPFRIEHICRKVLQRDAAGRKFSLIVVAEGAKVPAEDGAGRTLDPAPPGQVALRVGEAIGREVYKEVRVTVLGHVQRGGSPSPFDRVLATRFGCAAADLVAEDGFGRMVCLRAGKIESVPLDEAVGVARAVDPNCDHVRTARSIGISFGDGL